MILLGHRCETMTRVGLRGSELRIPFSTADDLAAFRYGFAPFGVDLSVGETRNSETSVGPVRPVQPPLGIPLYVSGQVVVPAVYGEVRSFSDGFAPFRSGERWGFLRSDGQADIRPTFLEVEHFADGCAACQAADSGWGLINGAGNGCSHRPLSSSPPSIVHFARCACRTPAWPARDREPIFGDRQNAPCHSYPQSGDRGIPLSCQPLPIRLDDTPLQSGEVRRAFQTRIPAPRTSSASHARNESSTP